MFFVRTHLNLAEEGDEEPRAVRGLGEAEFLMCGFLFTRSGSKVSKCRVFYGCCIITDMNYGLIHIWVLVHLGTL